MKFVALVTFCLLLLAPTYPSSANDGGSDPTFLMRSGTEICLTVPDQNMEKDPYFWVFDYSHSMGEKLGRPWSVIEPNECYQFDKNGGRIFRIKETNELSPGSFRDHSSFKSNDSIPSNFCESTGCYEDRSISEFTNIFSAWPDLGLRETDIIFNTGITADSVFPTNYNLGILTTQFVALHPDAFPQLTRESPFTDMQEKYTELAEKFQKEIRECDDRQRVEYRAEVDKESSRLELKGQLWTWPDQDPVLIDIHPSDLTYRTDSLEILELIGCRQVYAEFLETHQKDIDQINKWLDELEKEHGNLEEEFHDPIFIERSDEAIEEMWSFADGSLEVTPDEEIFLSPSDVEVKEETEPEPEISSYQNDSPSETEKETSTEPRSPAPPDQEEFAETPASEPTKEKKRETVLLSEDPFVRLYLVLPILAFLGLLSILLYRRYRNK